MNRFMDALEQGNLETLRKYPKADLHNHFALGGSRRFLYQATGKKIEPLVHPLASMAEMDQWSQKYIGQYFNSTEGRKLLIRATFQQAKEDGVTVLEIGEDVWGLKEFFHSDIDELVESFTSAQRRNRSRDRIKASDWVIKALSDQLSRRLFVLFLGK